MEFVIESGVLKECILKEDEHDVVIPEGVTSIGDYAFYECKNLTNIVIPEGVTSIGRSAFWYCENLTGIELPESVTTIGSYAFSGTLWLENKRKKHSCVVVNGILIDGKDCRGVVEISEGVTSIGDSAFRNCMNLTKMVIPEGVTSIGDYAFQYCSNLTAIVIPESVTSIGRGAFAVCEKLTDILIPESVTTIEDYAFSGTLWLENKRKKHPCVVVNGILIDGKDCRGEVEIPEGVTSIRDYAFYECKNLTNIVIPEGVTSIGESAFESCYKLTSVVLPKSVTSINWAAFGFCDNLTNVVIPEGVTSIDGMAFRYCKNLTDIVIPESVTSIGKRAFIGCEKLTNVFISENVTSIGDGVFDSCGNSPICEEYYLRECSAIDAVSKYIPSSKALAYTILYQSGKEWKKGAFLCLKEGKATVPKTVTHIINLLAKGQGAEQVQRAVDFVDKYAEGASNALLLHFAEIVGKDATLPDTLEQRIEEAKNNPVDYILLPDAVGDPIEKRCTEFVTANMVNDILKKSSPKSYGRIIDFSQITYRASGKPIAHFVADCLMAAITMGDYANWNTLLHDIISATNIGKIVDNHIENKFKKGDYLLFPLFASACSGKNITAMYNASLKFGRKKVEKERARQLLDALVHSNTREALLILEKKKMLGEAAKLRGMTEEELRDLVLAEFGFDEQGVKIYELGGNKAILRLGADFELQLEDENGTALKSIPKKGNDETLVKVASKDVSDLKKNVKKVVSQRAEILCREFAQGTEREMSAWKRVYMQNPVLRHFARLLVWEAEGVRFMPQADGSFCGADGACIEIPIDGMIKLAHPAEMSSQELAEWKNLLREKRIAQPFVQIFEKVYDLDRDELAGRYRGIKAMFYNVKKIEKEGEIRYDAGANIYGVHIAMSINSDDNWDGDWSQRTVELGGVTVSAGTKKRALNHVIALLDYICLDGAARADNTEILVSGADNITEKNIQKLIDAAASASAMNAVAWLMNYKNEHFQDRDIWADLEL